MTTLSQRLRDETRELHTLAERSGIMRPLLRGVLAPGDYALLLGNLHVIYVALERGLGSHLGLAALSPFAHAGLARASRMESDLEALSGRSWRDSIAFAPAATRYSERLHEISAERPAHLLAHAYVRYLGDLSGGLQIARIVRRGLPAELAGATAFYEFPDIADPDAFKQQVRAGLDATALSAADIDAVVAEARCGFETHAVLFDELAMMAEARTAPPDR